MTTINNHRGKNDGDSFDDGNTHLNIKKINKNNFMGTMPILSDLPNDDDSGFKGEMSGGPNPLLKLTTDF